MKNERTIVAALFGGMGNQMFQYAHACALAKRFGTGLALYWEEYWGMPRQFSLGQFGLRLTASLPPKETWRVIEDFRPYHPGMEEEIVSRIQEEDADVICLRGYFQNEAFFNESSEAVRTTFGRPLVSHAANRPAGSVAIHVRRTDFVGTAHAVCDTGYYCTAMELIRSRLPHPRFVVFSDDPEWCQREFAGVDDLEVRSRTDDQTDFREMMQFPAFIIPASTFSWWAAWLSNSQTVIGPYSFLADSDWVVAPRRWLTLRRNNTGTWSVQQAP